MPRITRDEILSRINVESFYTDRGLRLITQGEEWGAKCPFHEESNASFSINKKNGVFMCHSGSCSANGSMIDFLILSDGGNPKDKNTFKEYIKKAAQIAGLDYELGSGPPPPRPKPPVDREGPLAQEEEHDDLPPIPEEKVDRWHERLLNDSGKVKFLHDVRGLSEDTIKMFRLGFDGERYMIPIRDDQMKLLNVRKYLPNAGAKQQKMMSYSQRGGNKIFKYGKAQLFPGDIPEGLVLICEGEMDCMLAIQEGFPAVTPTSGAGYWNRKWNERFTGRKVVIVFDKDEAGRKGAQNVAKFLSGHAESIAILNWPAIVPDRGDITDFLVNLGGDKDGLMDLVKKARKYILPEEDKTLFSSSSSSKKKESSDSIRVRLSDATLAEHTGKSIIFRGQVSGKDTAPFIIPRMVEVRCNEDLGAQCGGCGMSILHHGSFDVVFDDSNRQTLGLKDCTDAMQTGFIAKAAGINVKGCPKWRKRIVASQNLEEISVIPEINGKLQKDQEGEYVTRSINVLGHSIKPNTVYEFTGYSYPDVKSQRATSLTENAASVSISIDTFQPDVETIESLMAFQPAAGGSVKDKMYEIAGELAKVTRVWGREDLNIAYDLVFHSVLNFRCFSEDQPRGWTEVMVVGDSGQGKTTMATRLSDYYQAGERVQAEQASGAGLIGGLSKMGDRWQINWGPLVLNDRRLLIIDEFSGIKDEIATAMTDIRSTGIAEIIKIHRERAWARTRLIFISNPKNGRTLGTFEHGVESLRGLFRESADIRRLDFAVACATGDVPSDRINSAGVASTPCAYTTEQCSNLVLWAWSRKPHQIVFAEGFEQSVYDRVKWLTGRFAPDIPLVEPGDQRWTLARLACAAAAREFSTEDGVNLLVTPAHVDFVAEYLDRVYSAPAMAYNSFSRRIIAAEAMIVNNAQAIKDKLIQITQKPKALIELLLTEHHLSPRDMEAQLGVSRDVTKEIISYLTSMRCVERAKQGLRKKPAFITILKEMDVSTLPDVPVDNDLFGEPVTSAKGDDDDIDF